IPQATLRQAPSGALHVTYLAGSAVAGEVRHAMWNGITWSTHVVAPGTTGDLGCLSLAVDSAGRPHVLFADTTARTLVLADGAAAAPAWQLPPVPPGGAGEAVSLGGALALDAADAPHIASALSSAGGGTPPVASFTYAIFGGSKWSTATVP